MLSSKFHPRSMFSRISIIWICQTTDWWAFRLLYSIWFNYAIWTCQAISLRRYQQVSLSHCSNVVQGQWSSRIFRHRKAVEFGAAELWSQFRHRDSRRVDAVREPFPAFVWGVLTVIPAPKEPPHDAKLGKRLVSTLQPLHNSFDDFAKNHELTDKWKWASELRPKWRDKVHRSQHNNRAILHDRRGKFISDGYSTVRYLTVKITSIGNQYLLLGLISLKVVQRSDI